MDRPVGLRQGDSKERSFSPDLAPEEGVQGEEAGDRSTASATIASHCRLIRREVSRGASVIPRPRALRGPRSHPR